MLPAKARLRRMYAAVIGTMKHKLKLSSFEVVIEENVPICPSQPCPSDRGIRKMGGGRMRVISLSYVTRSTLGAAACRARPS